MHPAIKNQKTKIKNGAASGSTLIELLVLMILIAMLAAILIPVISAFRRSGKAVTCEALIDCVGTALETYHGQQGAYPPDYVPAGYRYYEQHKDALRTDSPAALPPEALYYYLANPFVSKGEAYLKLQETAEWKDYDGNGNAEIVDSWGWPLLYNRGKFPGRPYNVFNYAGPSGNSDEYEDPSDHKPWHNKDRFDLYSLGPDGTTGGWPHIPDPGAHVSTLGHPGGYVDRAMKAASLGPSCGNEPHDINNW